MILTIDQLKQIASAGGGFVIDASTNRQAESGSRQDRHIQCSRQRHGSL